MNQYYITYNKTINLVLAMVFIPLTITPFFVLMAIYFPNLPEWAIFTIIFALLGVAVLFTLYSVKKLSPKGTLILNDDGFIVEFSDQNIFTPRSFEIKLHEISNFYPEVGEGGAYMSFTTSVRPYKFNISAAGKKEEETDSFNELMIAIAEMVDKRNETKAGDEQPTTVISVYQRGWMRALIIISGIVVLAIAVGNIIVPVADGIGWARLGLILVVGIPIAYKVYTYNKKKKGT